MQRSHKIKLEPSNLQATYFKKACGVKRFTYNWGLAEWERQYSAGLKPSAFQLRKEFNALKREQFPFVTEVTKCAAECAFANLDKAFKNFFKKKAKYPKFKKKGIKDSFYLSNDAFSLNGRSVRIPRLGKVKMAETLRFEGKIQSATISCTAGKWFISISVETEDEIRENQSVSAVGIDLGITKLATLSDGTTFENPKTTKKFAKRLRRLNKSLTRKKKGSENWKKAKYKLSNLHYKIVCVRADAIHNLTSLITKTYSDICIEDLNVRGMAKNRRLSKAVSDASFREIRRQLEYKSERIHFVDRFFPSSKLCMSCGTLHEMPLSQRVFKCDCGVGPLDRDLHAAQNILRQGLPNYKPVEREALAAEISWQ